MPKEQKRREYLVRAMDREGFDLATLSRKTRASPTLLRIAIMIWFMARIKHLADILFPLPEKEGSRPRCHAERLHEEINRDKYTPGEERMSRPAA